MKAGTESMPNALPDISRSNQLPCRTAQTIAIGMPIASAVISAMSISSTDTGRRLAIAPIAVSPVRKERPRSPCRTPASQCR